MFFVLVKTTEANKVFYPRAVVRQTGRTTTAELQEAEVFLCRLEQASGPDGAARMILTATPELPPAALTEGFGVAEVSLHIRPPPGT